MLDSGCETPAQLIGERGEFSSENYPRSYDNGKSCSWTITVDSKKVGSPRSLGVIKGSKGQVKAKL